MSRDNTEFTGTHCVIIPQDAFDPDAVFYDELEVRARRLKPDLHVAGMDDETLFDRVARKLDKSDVEWESDDPIGIEHDLTIDGLESSMFGRIRNYFKRLKP